ncbi:MAG: ATP-binding protein [Bacteroidales bacterium]|jgi:signal transduction histidine kinase|nr:ATP-binding protein [Bacteroidales bacterium]
MVFKRFKNILLIYLLAIIFLTALGIYILLETYFWLLSLWVFAILIILSFSFIRFVSKEHRKLAGFIQSIEQNDFKPPHSKSFADIDLNNAFQKLAKVIMALRDEAHINAQYLQTLINEVKTSILCFNENNQIVLYNTAAKELFQKSNLKNIHSLKYAHEKLPQFLMDLSLEDKKLIKLYFHGMLFNYSVQLANFKIRDKKYKLYTFQNVQSELEYNELESWQKLTRTLTHEIMNSAIPISNLSDFVYQNIFKTENPEVTFKNDNFRNDLEESLSTIERRSKGLVHFVNATRNFTKMPEPKLRSVSVYNIVNRVITLFKNRMAQLNISFQFDFNIIKDAAVTADESLLEQALINILLNAMEVLPEVQKPTLKITVDHNKINQTVISIRDNGPGISKENLENIFVPFFTTKKRGSGIGLSLSKQIMFLHKGNLTVNSTPGEGATFKLIL